MYQLPKELQELEMVKRFFDERILDRLREYQKTEPASPPEYIEEELPERIKKIPLLGAPWSVEEEKKAWGEMDFSPFPEKEPDPSSLTASHLRQYIAQQLCPRLAYFQRMRFMAKSHPRLIRQEEERQSKRNERERFRALVLQELQKKYRVCPESEHFRWEEALEEVVRTGEPLFFVQPMLTMQQEMRLQGRPDLIYLKRESSYVYAEVWDIREGYTVSYAQKWKIAFYAYLLESFLTTIVPLQPVRVADMGGIMHRSEHEDQLLDRTYFSLRDFRDTMPHLLRQWMDDSKKPHAHTMESSCTSCSYFSYCYQETLGQLPPVQDPHILYVGNASNQFPSNTKHWFFLFAYPKKIQWECWDGGECIDAGDATKERYEPFYRRWMQSAQQGKNPHILVLEDTDWEVCKKMFHKTPVAAIWGLHVCWTSMQSVWEEHFVWPFQGKVTATQVALSLGLLQDREPLFSLYHTDKAIPLSREIYRKIWAWCFSHIKSRRKVLYNLPVGGSLSLIPSYQAVLHREQECRTHAILEFQRNPLPHRVENFRAIGPLRFVAVDGPKRYLFSLVQRGPIAKFKVGDYLKLSPLGSSHLQEGFSVILEFYCPDQGRVVVRSLLRRITIHPHQLYVLDECAEDRNTSKMQAVLQQFAKPHFRPEILQLLQGRAPPSLGSTEWVENWDFAHAALSRLNASQKQALFLPFVKNVGLIEGPPGTGKTHLLVWTIVALCAHARSLHQHIKILVTAQTHQAIDQILKKTAQALKTLSMEGITLWKRGRYDPLLFGRCGVQSLEEATQLLQESLCIVGATGFGIYQLFEGAQFPQIFDWVVFDESSQV